MASSLQALRSAFATPPGRAIALGLAFLLLAGELILTVGLALEPITNPDTFFHLRFGHEFLHSWAPWAPGHIGINDSADWTPTQWLPQVAMGFVEDRWGLAGISILFALALAAVVLGLFLMLRTLTREVWAAGLTGLVLASVESWLTPRPVLLSFLLMGLCVWLTLRAYDRNRAPWALVPLVWVWAMTHGSWLTALPLLAAATVAVAIEKRALLKRQAGVLLAACAVPFLTPVGPGVLTAALILNERGKRYSEWVAVDFTSLKGLFIVGLVLAVALAWALRRQRDWLTLGLAAYSLILIGTHGRAAAMGVIVLCFVLARLMGRAPASSKERRSVVGLGVGLAAVAVALVCAQAPSIPAYSPLSSGVESRLTALAPGTVVYTYDHVGSYLLYSHPTLDPYYHGQVDVYTDEEWVEFGALPQMAPGWLAALDRARVQIGLLPAEDPHVAPLLRAGWTKQYEDGAWVLLAPPVDSPPAAM